MRKIVYNSFITATALLAFGKANAQHNYGVATSNWSTFNSLYLNPANIADCREKFTINIFSVTTGVDNNLGSIENGGIINSVSKGEIKFNYSNNGQASLTAPYAEVRGPGAVVSINNRHSVALTTGVRGYNQFHNFDQSLYRIITDPNYVSSNDIDLTSITFNYTAHLWSQIGLSYGGVVYNKGHHEIRVGATVRYLGGVGYIGLKGKNLDAHFRSGADSFYANNSDIEYASNVLSTRSALANGLSNNSIFSEFFGSKSGSGIGADLGVVYDFIPGNTRLFNMDGHHGLWDGSVNRYLLRFSASVVDIGAVNYSAEDNFNANVSGNGYLTGQGLKDNVSNYEDFRKYVVTKGFHADTIHAATKLHLPTMLLLSVDYHIIRPFYVNLAYAGSLVNRNELGNSNFNTITVTPRFDTRLLSVGLPISYSALAKNMRVGVGARFSGFFIGSDDMLALFSGSQYGFNFYIGASVPFYKKKMRDHDGDGISDARDRCPDEPGTWENGGCPPENERTTKAPNTKDKDKDRDQEE